MSRFRRLSHTIWHCQYHIVWCPKYRYRVLVGMSDDGLWRTRKQRAARAQRPRHRRACVGELWSAYPLCPHAFID